MIEANRVRDYQEKKRMWGSDLKTIVFRTGVWLLAISSLICGESRPAHASGGGDPDEPLVSAVGVSVGIPHTLAITYERYLGTHLAARVHLGTAVLLSSAGGRFQWGHNRIGFRPYFFAGGTLIHSVAGDYGDPKGVTGYFWLGPGVSLRNDRWEIYTEASALLGGDEEGGLGHDWVFPFSPAITAGLMLRF